MIPRVVRLRPSDVGPGINRRHRRMRCGCGAGVDRRPRAGGDSSVTCPMAIHEHARIAPCGLQFPAECPNSRTVVDGAGCAVAIITIMPVPVSRETDSSFVVPTHQFFARRRPCRLTLHQWDDGRHAIAAPGLSTYVLDLDLRAVQPSCLVSPPPRSHPHTPPPSTPSLPQVAYTCCSWTSSARR